MRLKGHKQTNEFLQAFIEKTTLRALGMRLKGHTETNEFLQAFIKKGL